MNGPDRAAGNMSVMPPDPSIPTPSRTALEVAADLMYVPVQLGEIVREMQRVTEGLEAVDRRLRSLVEHLSASPKNFFLNEVHETHVTKSQARKERAALKKTKSKGKVPRRSRVARKSRTRRSRSR